MQHWHTELTDGVFVAAYYNPPTNYMIAPAIGELGELIARWREPDVKAVVLTGAVPDRYITHYSVEELVEMGDDPAALVRASHTLIYGYHTLLRSLAYLDKSIVVGMTGDTMGCGLELSLNCDIRVAQYGDFRIGFPEVALGILTGTGSQLLARIIGHGRALDFLMRSRTVTPAGALELGIVTELATDARARRRNRARTRDLGTGLGRCRQTRDQPRRQPADGGRPQDRGRGMAQDHRHRRGHDAHARLCRATVR